MIVPHSGEAALRQTFPRPQQPTPIGPLRIELAAPVVAQFPGDAAAHLGQRVVAELDEVEVVDHDLAEAYTAAGSMATNSIASRNCSVRSRSQSMTGARVRPSRCPSKPRGAGQVDEPGVQWIDPHPPPRQLAARPVGLSAAGLVDAEHPGRFGLRQKRLGVGDERAVRGRPRHPVDGGDLRHRARAGTCSMDSVKEPRSQSSSRHRQRVLFHRTMIRFSP